MWFSTASILSARECVGNLEGGGGKLETQPVIIREIITMEWTNKFANLSSLPGSAIWR
jgi:hypothetical protein